MGDFLWDSLFQRIALESKEDAVGQESGQEQVLGKVPSHRTPKPVSPQSGGMLKLRDQSPSVTGPGESQRMLL